MSLILAIYAPKGSGKTTAADYINEWCTTEIKRSVTRLSFAAFYKKIALYIGFDLSRKDIVDKELGITPRNFLCAIGDFFRHDLVQKTDGKWLNGSTMALSSYLIQRQIEKLHGLIIIDDLRYMEEYEMLKQFNTIFVFINRPEVHVDPTHNSEREVYHMHQLLVKESKDEILNTATFKEFRANIERWSIECLWKVLKTQNELTWNENSK